MRWLPVGKLWYFIRYKPICILTTWILYSQCEIPERFCKVLCMRKKEQENGSGKVFYHLHFNSKQFDSFCGKRFSAYTIFTVWMPLLPWPITAVGVHSIQNRFIIVSCVVSFSSPIVVRYQLSQMPIVCRLFNTEKIAKVTVRNKCVTNALWIVQASLSNKKKQILYV